jgi:hypothetical protein
MILHTVYSDDATAHNPGQQSAPNGVGWNSSSSFSSASAFSSSNRKKMRCFALPQVQQAKECGEGPCTYQVVPPPADLGAVSISQNLREMGFESMKPHGDNLKGQRVHRFQLADYMRMVPTDAYRRKYHATRVQVHCNQPAPTKADLDAVRNPKSQRQFSLKAYRHQFGRIEAQFRERRNKIKRKQEPKRIGNAPVSKG